MVKGFFIENTPFVEVAVGGNKVTRSAFFVLDTGFSGDLQMNPQIASDIGLHALGAVSVRLADGSVVEVPFSSAVATMEDALTDVEVLVIDSMPLVGINFLTKFGYSAMVDCSKRRVCLSRYSEIKVLSNS